jgi:hypothetical protein
MQRHLPYSTSGPEVVSVVSRPGSLSRPRILGLWVCILYITAVMDIADRSR